MHLADASNRLDGWQSVHKRMVFCLRGDSCVMSQGRLSSEKERKLKGGGSGEVAHRATMLWKSLQLTCRSVMTGTELEFARPGCHLRIGANYGGAVPLKRMSSCLNADGTLHSALNSFEATLMHMRWKPSKSRFGCCVAGLSIFSPAVKPQGMNRLHHGGKKILILLHDYIILSIHTGEFACMMVSAGEH